ncbi:hypothetical protein APUTEX25_000773 [Auxenochlorella protothecoides]|uniref:Uncharacterized protein n=1 Tax=Auxenochlorella protothecoides TaxID=3075 RepID=A0A3M7KS20_AUXPR|nr:hypothetical protein APUTEX25_000773 [Auxenochlorella protothecoides]|eukprot:RMZ52654.1 hypothetical protein APUTEX25_000773 [Auxenochlorella protothecoides]
MVRFLIPGPGPDATLAQEADTHGDVVIVPPASDGTHALLAEATTAHRATFVMKAEDSTWLDPVGIMQELLSLCMSPGCEHERLYLGREQRPTASLQERVDVTGQPPRRRGRVDAVYAAHTSLSSYMPYMLGGGYVLSRDLAQLVLEVNTHASAAPGFLKLLPSEDVSIGVWLMSVDLRRVDQPRMLESAGPDVDCCFASGNAAAEAPEEFVEEGGQASGVDAAAHATTSPAPGAALPSGAEPWPWDGPLPSPTVDVCAVRPLAAHPVRFAPGAASLAFLADAGGCDSGPEAATAFVARVPRAWRDAGAGAVWGSPPARQLVALRLPEPPLALAYRAENLLIVWTATGAWQVRLPANFADGLPPTRRLAGSEAAAAGASPASCAMSPDPTTDRLLLASTDAETRDVAQERRRYATLDLGTGRLRLVGEYSAGVGLGGGPLDREGSPAPSTTQPPAPAAFWSPDGRSAAFASPHSGGGWAGVRRLGGRGGDDPGDGDAAGTVAGVTSHPTPLPPRSVFVEVGAGAGAGVRAFRAARGAEGWQVHAWEAAPAALRVLRDGLPLGVQTHGAAAWVRDGEVALNPLPAAQGPSPGWLAGAWLAAWGAPPHPASLFGREAPGAPRESVPALDFGAWLLRTLRPGDRLWLRLDVAGAELELLAQLLQDGSLARAGRVSVAWGDGVRPLSGQLAATWRSVFDLLGVAWSDPGSPALEP